MDASWEASDAKEINLSDLSGDLTLSEAGTYLLSGELDGRICVAVSETEKVRLILNGVTNGSTQASFADTNNIISLSETELVIGQDGYSVTYQRK